MRYTAALSFVSLAGLVMLAGCTQRPAGYSKGRVEPTTTTAGEIASKEVFPAALIEASDQFAQQLAADLADMPVVRNIDGPVTIIIGDIANKTAVTASTDFEMLRSRLRNSLLQSDFVTGKLHFVENRARMRAIAAREEVGPSPVEAGPPAYDPQRTFALNMDVYRVARFAKEGDSSLYSIEAQLVHLASNRIVAAPRQYEIKQWKP